MTQRLNHCTVEPQNYEPPWETRVFISLKSLISPIYCVVLFNFHEEYAATISIEYKLANTDARAL